ncbi:DUF1198 family protein, partial [Salmonella enterica subsp. enterica serovar Virginia]|nr:DUF1198 family protein [Salmonella enterica subsp. enterica serovar Virginia]
MEQHPPRIDRSNTVQRFSQFCASRADQPGQTKDFAWATFVVVFIVGFRVLTSDTRRAIRRLSERLNIDVVPIESMIDQMG